MLRNFAGNVIRGEGVWLRQGYRPEACLTARTEPGASLVPQVRVIRLDANLGQGRIGRASEIIFAVEESPEGGYEARALGHSIFTQADALHELREMVSDSVRCHCDTDSITAVRLWP